ncbi:MAG: hypothetical protein C0518_02680 [Opitutus sp.]|nr:hypothetical protein [Opitutus sp.]
MRQARHARAGTGGVARPAAGRLAKRVARRPDCRDFTSSAAGPLPGSPLPFARHALALEPCCARGGPRAERRSSVKAGRAQNLNPAPNPDAVANRVLRWAARAVCMRGVSTPTASLTAQRFVPVLLVLALALFATGIFFPFFHVAKFWIFHEAVSVVGGMAALFREGEYFLFVVLTLFTLVFPCVKLGLLGVIWMERDHDLARVRRLHSWVAALGKWSMLDVFVVGILIVTMKAAGLAKIQIGLGLYLFTFSVVATQAASAWIDRLLRK